MTKIQFLFKTTRYLFKKKQKSLNVSLNFFFYNWEKLFTAFTKEDDDDVISFSL